MWATVSAMFITTKATIQKQLACMKKASEYLDDIMAKRVHITFNHFKILQIYTELRMITRNQSSIMKDAWESQRKKKGGSRVSMRKFLTT